MLQVKVEAGHGMNKHTGIVNVFGFDSLTPRAARAALQIAGWSTGTVWTMAESTPDGLDYDSIYGYRVYAKSARKVYPY